VSNQGSGSRRGVCKGRRNKGQVGPNQVDKRSSAVKHRLRALDLRTQITPSTNPPVGHASACQAKD